MKTKSILTGTLWGTCSFAFVHILMPLLSVGLPDGVWIMTDLCALALLFIILRPKEKFSLLLCLITGCGVWYLLLLIFAAPISKIYGITLTGLGAFAYIGAVALWPIVGCTVSAAAALLYMKIKK